jgi:hypothetical protein
MHVAARPVDYSRSGLLLAGLFVVTLFAFWPTYLSQKAPASSVYTHLHAVTASVWMLLLIVQPIAIRKRQFGVHRLLGRLSYGVAPLVAWSMVLLANHRIRIATPESYPIQTYILYLQISLILLFGIAYVLAIYNRHVVAVHARLMVCTAITLIDPILIRIMFQIGPVPAWNYQWLTFGVTDLVLVILIWMERHSRSGRRVLPLMLLLFVVLQVPALFGWTDGALWQAFARWFATVPLTPAAVFAR